MHAGMRDTLLLWTGGFDSTFRLCQLVLVERRPVLPIYIANPRRRSLLVELKAMEGIRQAIRRRDANAAALIRPTRLHLIADYLPVPAHIKRRYELLEQRCKVGSQYAWLAAAAETHDWGAELCMPRHEPASDLQRAIFESPGTDDPTLCADEAAKLFEYWRFPLLGLTKAEMRASAESKGFYNIVLLRVFCHEPAFGRPCGRCRPCQIAIVDGADQDVTFATRPAVRLRDVWRRLEKAITVHYAPESAHSPFGDRPR